MALVSFIIIVIYAAFYFGISLMLRQQLQKNEVTATEGTQIQKSIVLVIPFRDEYQKLESLLVSIAGQNRIPDEIILINDHSTDGSDELLESLLPLFRQLPIQCLYLPIGKEGKKAALTLGVETALSEIMITSDADCTFHPDWVKCFLEQFIQTECNLIFGMVNYQEGKNWIEKYQQIESRALINTGLAMFMLQKPVMCNGANLAFKKEVWQQVKGYEGNSNIATGDDIFLLHKVYQLNAKKVGFINLPQAIVTTAPTPTIQKFLSQRKRWASKSGKYQFWWANAFPIFIALINLSVLICFIIALLQANWMMAIMILIIKNMADFSIINANPSFAKPISALTILLFQPWQWLYPFLLLFVQKDWKRD